MERYTEHAQYIYRTTQRDCSKFSFRPAVQQAQRKIIAVMRGLVRPGEKFLDVGCGAGQLVALVREELGMRSTGVTLSPDEVAAAQRAGIELIRSDMHDIDAADGEYDLVYAGHVLEHSVSPTIALREWRRVLKSNGHLMIWSPIGRDFKGHDDGTVVYGCADHLLTPTEWQYKWMFEITGLSVVAEYDLPHQPHGPRARLRRVVVRTLMKVLQPLGLTVMPRHVPGTSVLYVLAKKPD